MTQTPTLGRVLLVIAGSIAIGAGLIAFEASLGTPVLLPVILLGGGLIFLGSSAHATYRASEAGFEGDDNSRQKHSVCAFLFLLVGAIGVWHGCRVAGWI